MLVSGNKVRLSNAMGATLQKPRQVIQGHCAKHDGRVTIASQSKHAPFNSECERNNFDVQKAYIEQIPERTHFNKAMGQKCIKNVVSGCIQVESVNVLIEILLFCCSILINSIRYTSTEVIFCTRIQCTNFNVKPIDT